MNSLGCFSPLPLTFLLNSVLLANSSSITNSLSLSLYYKYQPKNQQIVRFPVPKLRRLHYMLSMPMPPPQHLPPTNEAKNENEENPLVFDASVAQYQSSIPSKFIWPDHEKPCPEPPELPVPHIDMKGFLTGDTREVSNATCLVDEACRKHGFFLVVNHGVDSQLIAKAHEYMDLFFGMQLSQKQRAQRKTGDHCGYASSFIGRFSSKQNIHG